MANIRNSAIDVWGRVAVLAGSQSGLITRKQLRRLGFSDAGIARATAWGSLHPLFRGVFSVGHAGIDPDTRLLAATLACGDGTVVSHGTAAWLLGLRDWQPLEVDVIAPVESGRKIDGLKRRFVPPPSPLEVGVSRGVPTTGVARTIVDCAGILGTGDLAELIEAAAVRKALRIPRIDRILDGPRRRGARKLLRLLEPWRRYKPGIHIRSRMEAKLLPLLTSRGLAIPQTNAKLRIDGRVHEVDFLWRCQMVIVETDGGAFHGNPAAGERDSRRTRALLAAGYSVPRIGWEDLRDRPRQTLDEIAALLR